MNNKWQMLMQEAEKYYSQGNYKEALYYFRKAVDEADRCFGRMHPNYTQSLTGLALTYKQIAEYDKAEQLFHNLLQCEEMMFGRVHQRYATALNNLGEFYRSIGKYREAEHRHLGALKIKLTLFGENHPDVALTLHNLAVLYKNMGKYDNAEALYRQAMTIWKNAFENLTTREKATEKYIVDYASSLNGLAGVFVKRGEYNKAELLYLETLEIREKYLGDTHPHYALTLNNIGEVYRLMEDYAEAEYHYNEALKIRERSPGKNSLEYAQSLNNLALLYHSMIRYYEAAKKYQEAEEKFRQAEQLYLQALDIHETKLRGKHIDLTKVLHNLAGLYLAKGDHLKAKRYVAQSLETMKSVLGDKHPDVAISLFNLASIHSYNDEHEEAKRVLHQAIEILKTQLGERHPSFGLGLYYLALAENLTGHAESAIIRMLEASEIDTIMINRLASTGNEKQLQSYIRSFQANYFALLSIFVENSAILRTYTSQVFDFILNRKALVLEISAIRRDSILSSQKPELKNMVEQLAQLRTELSNLHLKGCGNNDSIAYLKTIFTLEMEIETQERILSAHVPASNLEKKLLDTENQKIACLLPENSCLIEWVWHIPFDFKARKYLDPCYIVFILSSNLHVPVQLIKIENASEIDGSIKNYIEKILSIGLELLENNLREDESIKDSIKSTLSIGKSLYDKIFQPILDCIGETKRLIISPDYEMAFLPFEAVPQPNNRFIVEDFEISYINSGRDLLRFQEIYKSQSRPLIVANPDFDLKDLNDFDISISNQIRNFSETEKIIENPKATEMERTFHFASLIGTREEAENIRDIFNQNADLWLEKEVLEGRLKKIRSPQILHIATHGFFLPTQQVDQETYFGTSGLIHPFGQEENLHGIRYKNPLLRSGLALAGANTFIQGKKLLKDAEDGILTALDVTGIDLMGTDLVVLSACETGLGEAEICEGVHGLRRAFISAGAKSLIVSLWKVPDEKTKELMVDFYDRLIRKKAEKAQALRESQRDMIKRLRDQGGSAFPYFWGAFICIGHPGHMQN